MQVSSLFRIRNNDIQALHLTWIAFFICFYVWFNMAPLASSILASADWLTRDDLRLFAIANVALTIPARFCRGSQALASFARTACSGTAFFALFARLGCMKGPYALSGATL